MTGRTISHYRILEKLGEGGMGVVYKAEDLKLERIVALKFLAAHALESPDLKARFIHEAKAAAAIDHPNICTVYEIDEAEGQTFIAMAFVDGPSLREKIDERPLRLDEALDIAIQVAEGLQAAHEKEIFHRDIKSSNIMLTPRGQVKILDFGLAHLAGRTKLTKAGSTLGTPAYMSPEQVRGENVDRRTDIWSAAVVLYEMVSGQLPFKGEVEAAVSHGILDEEPEPLTALRAGLPIQLDRIVAKALAKSADERYPHADDMLVDLRSLRRQFESRPGSRAPQPARTSRAAWYVAGAAVAVALILGAWVALRGPAAKAPEAPLTAVPLTSYPGYERNPTFSPDGNQVAFSWSGEKADNLDIYVKMIGSGGPMRLTTDPADDDYPAWSPDGKQIAFRRSLGGGKFAVLLIPPLGGPERKVTEVSPVGGLAWHPGGEYLAVGDRDSPAEMPALFLLSIGTGEKRKVTSPPAESGAGDSVPAFSPDGRKLVFTRLYSNWISELYLLSLSEDLKPLGEPERLTSANLLVRGSVWTQDGQEIIFSSGPATTPSLWRLPASGSGSPQRLASVGEDGLFPTISPRGNRLVYVRRHWDTDVWRVEVGGPGQEAGPPVKLISSTRYDVVPEFSPDGRRITFRSDRSGSPEIWVCDSDGSNPVQLTSFGGPHCGAPSWSPDSKSIAFGSRLEGPADIYVINSEGGTPRRITTSPAVDDKPTWSQDGNWIYFESTRSGENQVWKIPSEGGQVVQVTKNKNGVHNAHPSSDGRFFYYRNRTAGWTSLWRVPAGGGEETKILDSRNRISHFTVTDLGIYFITTPDADDAYYLSYLDFASGKIRQITEMPGQLDYGLSVSPDGRFILFTRSDQAGSDLMLVENFR